METIKKVVLLGLTSLLLVACRTGSSSKEGYTLEEGDTTAMAVMYTQDYNDRVAEIETEEIREQDALEMLEDKYKGIGEIKFDGESKEFRVYPHDRTLNEVIRLAKEGYPHKVREWDSFMDSFIDKYNYIRYYLGDEYSLSVANYENTENTVLIIKGNLMYDAVADILRSYGTNK